VPNHGNKGSKVRRTGPYYGGAERPRKERNVIEKVAIEFASLASLAGFPVDSTGKASLPATQETADRLAAEAVAYCGGHWVPGMARVEVVITGAGPVWAYLVIAHALHGRCVRLTYAAPNATIVVFDHAGGEAA
jgi:hypothetical protein